MFDQAIEGRPSSLRHVALLDFFARDSRPTFVLEQAQIGQPPFQQPKIIYRNRAFESFLESSQLSGTQHSSFNDWVRTLSAGNDNEFSPEVSEYGGRAWTNTQLYQTWTVVCADASLPSATGSSLVLPTRPLPSPLLQPVVAGDDSSIVSSEPQRSSTVESISSTVDSLKSTLSEDAPTTTLALDWTRFPLAEVTPHIVLVRDYPWHETALGPMELWSDSLRSVVVWIMNNPDPRLILVGKDCVMIYNEPCCSVFGRKHPAALGRPAVETWGEIWADVKPMVSLAVDQGKTTKVTDMQLMMERYGWLEETYWNFSMLPIIGAGGYGLGALDEFTEATRDVIGKRRREGVMRLNTAISHSSTLQHLWASFIEALVPDNLDLPFGLIYSLDRESKSSPNGTASYILAGSLGFDPGEPSIPNRISLESPATVASIANACLKASTTNEIVLMSNKDDTLPAEFGVSIPGRGFGDKVTDACVLPVGTLSQDTPDMFLIFACNPRRQLNREFVMYVQYMRDLLAKAAALISLPEEQQRNRRKFEQIEHTLTQRLKEHEERFTRMASSAPVGMYSFAQDGSTIYVNDNYLSLIGVTREVFMADMEAGLGWSRTLHDDDVDLVAETWKALAVDKKGISVEYRVKKIWEAVDKATGKVMSGPTWLLATAMPEFDEDGNFLNVQGWLVDVSHEKFIQKLLAQRLDEVTEAKRQSENFIDMTSHEMRNPLSAILQSADGILSALDSSNLPLLGEQWALTYDTAENVIDAAQTIILCAQHQKRIVDDILTISKLDSNLLAITPDKTQPDVLLGRAVKMYEAELHRAGIQATIEIEPSYRTLDIDFIMLDSSRVLQVIINLLTNAIKFTQSSYMREIVLSLGASLVRPTGQHHNVHFVPQRTARTEHAITPEWGSGQDVFLQFAVQDTGLGLSPEEMSLLFLRFSQASPKTYKQYGGSGLGLFISRELTELQDGQIGVCSESKKGSTFTFYIRARRWVPDTPVIPSSSAGQLQIPPHSSNPVAFTRRGSVPLDDTIPSTTSLIGDVPPKQAAAAPKANGSATQPTSASTLHVLIVEDNLINQRVMAKQISALGHVVHVANHGVEALKFLETTQFWASSSPVDETSAANQLSVVLCDQEMPVMDGLTCVRRIRDLQTTGQLNAHVPVIAVTANARSEQITKALNAGMDEVVTKPFRIPQVMERAQMLVTATAGAAVSGARG